MPRLSATACVSVLALMVAAPGIAAPAYDFDRKELEAILDDLVAWLPGEWSSYPQIYHERAVRVPAEGEHDDWYRTFARIDAPQIGEYVFYGQINIGGRDGPLMSRSQVLYKAEIDMVRQRVLVRGQTPKNPEQYVNLQDHPQLWHEVEMRDPAQIHCDFLWHRNGTQIVGVLDGPTDERRKFGPGTCNYTSAQTNSEFMADAEWVLSPDELWLYDINVMGGQQFIGRKDRTHIRLYRARPYRCEVSDARGKRSVDANDRGYAAEATGVDSKQIDWQLLRARFAAADGSGLDEQLRLIVATPAAMKRSPSGAADELDHATAAPAAAAIKLDSHGVRIDCRLADKFPPMPAD
ncbi:MAG: hypothetical protein KDI32_00805 [Pseudomonadales bacterium]|nr:hypothetical protein [Pseudomonadales bacterium]